MGLHHYKTTTVWTGNLGSGTSGYEAYSRNHDLTAEGKATVIAGSSDAAFRGDPTRHTPEEMLIESLSACHMLWFLHLCADAGIVVTEYTDSAEGTMGTEFLRVTLHPRAVIADAARIPDVEALHQRAHEVCYIARSVNFPVVVEPETTA
jgi:organic hydroperoxide reductase OsmC/OhrA